VNSPKPSKLCHSASVNWLPRTANASKMAVDNGCDLKQGYTESRECFFPN